MYGVQNRIFCGVCHISVLPDNYQTHLRSQGYANNVLKNSCNNSRIIKTRSKKDERKQNLSIIEQTKVYIN